VHQADSRAVDDVVLVVHTLVHLHNGLQLIRLLANVVRRTTAIRISWFILCPEYIGVLQPELCPHGDRC